MSVAFVREESAEAAQEVTLPERPISTHPNLVTQSGFRALEQAVADSRETLRTAQSIQDANERRRPLELAARDARYFSERLASAVRGRTRRASRSSRSAIASRSFATTAAVKPTESSARTKPIHAPARSLMLRRWRVA
jgi:hypothetical protein